MHTPLKSNHPRRRRPSPAKGVCAGCSLLFGPKNMENRVCFPSCGHNLPAVFKSPSLTVSKLLRSCFVAAFFPRAPQASLSQKLPSTAQPSGLPTSQIPPGSSWTQEDPTPVFSQKPGMRGMRAPDSSCRKGWQEGSVEIPSRAGKEHPWHVPPCLPTTTATASKVWICCGPQHL